MSGLEEASLVGFDEAGSNSMGEVKGRQKPLSFRLGLLAGGVGMIVLLSIPFVALTQGAGSALNGGSLDQTLIGLADTSQQPEAGQAGMLTFARKDGTKFCLAWDTNTLKLSFEKWPCIGGAKKYYWTLHDNGNIKTVPPKNPSEAKCLDVANEKNEDGAPVGDLELGDCSPYECPFFSLREESLRVKTSKCSHLGCSYIEEVSGGVVCYDHMNADGGYRWAFEMVVGSWNMP